MSSEPKQALHSPSTQGTSKTLRISGIVVALVAAGVVVVGITSRASNDEKLKQWTDAQAVPSVNVINAGNAGAASTLDLPGRFEAYARAPIFARVNGYLKSWKVDIGGKVKAGQLLAEIETPDLDQQIVQAKADLASAQANGELAKITAKRWQDMWATNSVSRQEVDDRTSDYTNKQALVKSAQANVDRLIATKNFARVVAPFDGTVTARDTDTGALINAGGGTGPALFEVSDTRKLRLYVNVPQTYVTSIKPGTKADIKVPEHADKVYTATVESLSRSVDINSGTTLIQLAVNNTAGELLPGGYATVSLHQTANSTQAFSIPASAIIFDKSGLHVATVTTDNKVLLKPVTIARDLGKTIELGSGIDAQDRVIESPPDGIANGEKVNVAQVAAK